jgi:hypothetical protein
MDEATLTATDEGQNGADIVAGLMEAYLISSLFEARFLLR